MKNFPRIIQQYYHPYFQQAIINYNSSLCFVKEFSRCIVYILEKLVKSIIILQLVLSGQ